MTQNLKNEMNKYFEELEENIENKNDLEYVKEKSNKLISAFLNEFNTIENRITTMEKTIEKIQSELYLEDEYEDFDISCPYCDYEFSIEYDEERKETECPQCHNIIELNWNGDTEETGCAGNCSRCGGCGN